MMATDLRRPGPQPQNQIGTLHEQMQRATSSHRKRPSDRPVIDGIDALAHNFGRELEHVWKRLSDLEGRE